MSEEITGAGILGEGSVAESVEANPSTDTTGTWMDGMSEEEIGGIQNKGWNSPSDMYKSYGELEKYRGVPSDQIMIKPKDGESWDEFYSAMGRPSEASEYVYKSAEGLEDTSMLDGIKDIFFEKGGSADLFTAVTDKYDEMMVAGEQARSEQDTLDQQTQVQELQRELGTDYEKKIYQANQTATALGFDKDVLGVLEKGLGLKGTMAVLDKMGQTMGEDTVNSVNNTSPYGQTRESMVAEKQALMADIMADKTRNTAFASGVKNSDRLKINALNNSLFG